MRLRVAERSQAAPAAAAAAAAGPCSLHVPSSSFSSFSSSNLDTESTTSFFQDHSMTLGRLIGIKPGDRRSLYFPNTVLFQPDEIISEQALDYVASGNRETEASSRGTCVPLLHNMITKRSRSKSNARL